MAAADEPEASDRRRQIMEAALRVFSSKGFEKATNKDIAEAAGGISPGLIYHYFRDKQDLFFSILQERAPIIALAGRPEQLMELEPRAALTLIGRSYLMALGQPANVAMMRVLLSEIIRFPEIAEMFSQQAISRIFNLITSYLDLQVARGRLRPHNTGIATRSFVGMFLLHVLAREIFRQPAALATSDDEVIATAVELFLRGLAAEQEAE